MPDPDLPRQSASNPASLRPLPEVSETGVAGLGQLGEYRLLEELRCRRHGGRLSRVARGVGAERGDQGHAWPIVWGDTQAVERFRREIKAAGKLEHPNIVLAYDARQIGGKHILVMEFIEGLDFAQLLERVGPLPIADACEAVRQDERPWGFSMPMSTSWFTVTSSRRI